MRTLILHYLSPILLLVFYTTTSCLQRAKSSTKTLSKFINALLILVIVTYLGDAALVIVHAIAKREQGWYAPDHEIIYIIVTVFLYGAILVNFVDKPPALKSLSVLGTFSIASLSELALLACFLGKNDARHLSVWKTSHLAIQAVRLFLVCAVPVSVIIADSKAKQQTDEEAPLLNADGGASDASMAKDPSKSYGASAPTRPIDHGSPHGGETTVPDGKKKEAEGWWVYLKKFGVFVPYLWPKGNFYLQFVVVFCFGLLSIARVLNILVPRQLGIVTDELSGDVPATSAHIWGMVLLYVFYRFLQGNMGLVGALRSWLWVPVGQFTYRGLAVSSFEHVHGLSLDFHIGKKTGEVLSALDKGSAINSFLELLVFNVLPVIVDLFVAIVYFFIQFDVYFALIVGIMTVTYLYATVKITEWRTEIRRDMINKSREEYAVKADSITNYETVKYFNAEEWEFKRYEQAVKTYQAAEWKVTTSLNVMNVSQNLIFTLGLLAICLLSAYRVTTGQATVGSFVFLLTYMFQLQGPLNFFGTLYRSLQSNLVNAERMLELFTQNASIKDAEDAKELLLSAGEVKFDHVHFAYDQRKPALKGLNFIAKPGQTVALVGESGAGKTTILRTLFRFYDVNQGSIQIDGQDIRDVKIHSLRESIGVVPQDTVLFNDTIMFNIRYAKPECSDEEVYEAARKAQIHDKIMDWPDKYDSKVGERGLRLSGGEKQRIAIARTILKNPSIILLDEATSALDTTTERQIQAALDELAKGRTTLVIAHRLSTIIGSDLILCLKDGQVVEQGTHEELLRKAEESGGRGEYYSMWQKQIRAEKKSAKKKEAGDADGTEPTTAENSDVEGDDAKSEVLRAASEQPNAASDAKVGQPMQSVSAQQVEDGNATMAGSDLSSTASKNDKTKYVWFVLVNVYDGGLT
ncbi:protein of unknown function [Taphrina deformans PYCC 5710]|uniref:Heavy metal tolerance protein n=1 Tax=Taphrina deformans (strain PYCC 5710 / ATCC 11124 / CBS 356.35 / IMI 108563 / JCM 9778 / NBRC 8474) TaxID=1097556 RepID=R4XKE5_TAPDE|nr:protein of unknown function [Taphrina deformans PYCC 5710]|eukprot:CCG83794.1 protein of unknown function [Taphrina deformans PYCC 5710]